MYKVAAVIIFVVIAALIILVSVSTVRHANGADETTQDTSPLFADPNVAEETDSLNADITADTTAEVPADTTASASADTAAALDTAASVSVHAASASEPSRSSTEEWDSVLAKYPDTVLASTEDAGGEYIDKLIFLGDSTTYGLRAYKMLNGGKQTTQVWTPKSGTLTLTQVSFAKIVYPETNTEMTIKEAVTEKKPEYLVVTLGVNGVAIMDEEYFKSEYKKMLETIREASPDTKIICQSIFPVARSYKSLNDINNEKIMAANRWILEIADEVGVKFVDTYSALCDSEGWLPENYQNGDGMHLNEVSFKIELDNLRTHAYITE